MDKLNHAQLKDLILRTLLKGRKKLTHQDLNSEAEDFKLAMQSLRKIGYVRHEEFSSELSDYITSDGSTFISEHSFAEEILNERAAERRAKGGYLNNWIGTGLAAVSIVVSVFLAKSDDKRIERLEKSIDSLKRQQQPVLDTVVSVPSD